MSSTTAHDRRREERRRLARLAAEFADAPAPPPDLSVLLLAAAAVELYGGTTALLDAATIAHIDAGTVLRLSASGGSIAVVGPSQADSIAALLDDYDRLLLLPGTYVLTAPLTLPPAGGVELIAPWGTARFTVGFASGLGADDRTNALVTAIGTITAGTTITADLDVGNPTVTLTSAAAIGAVDGSVLLLRGANDDDPENNGAGAATQTSDIILAADVTGNVVTLDAPTRHRHSLGKAAYRITARPTSIYFENIHFDGTGSDIAVGVRLDYAADVRFVRCKFTQFSKSAVDSLCGHDDILDDWTTGGGLNGLYHASSPVNTRITNGRTSATGDRKHASGMTRHLIYVHDRPFDVRVNGNVFQHLELGVRFSGVVGGSVAANRWHDLHLSAATITASAAYLSTRAGVAFDSHIPGLTLTEWCRGVDLGDMVITECRVPYALRADWPAVMLIDQNEMSAGKILVRNLGKQVLSGGDDLVCTGVEINDCADSQIGAIVTQGCYYPLSVLETRGAVDIDLFSSNSQCPTAYGGGYDNSYDVAIRLDYRSGNGPRIRRVKLSNHTGLTIRAGTSMTAGGVNLVDWRVLVDEWDAEGVVAARCRFALTEAATVLSPGDLVYLIAGDNTNEQARKVVQTTATTQHALVVAASDAEPGYILVGGIESGCSVSVDMAVECGDILVPSAGTPGKATVDNTPGAGDWMIGRATVKTSGSGLVPVERIGSYA